MSKDKSKSNNTNANNFDKYYKLFKSLIGTQRKVQITYLNPDTKVKSIYEGVITGLSSKSVGMLYNNMIITIAYNLIQSYIVID